MSAKQTYSRFQFLKAWVKAHAPRPVEALSLLAILLGCLIFGALTLVLPEHKAYHKGKVRYVGVRHGSKRPGAHVMVDLPNGKSVFVTTLAYVPSLEEGAQICVQELRGMIRGGTFYKNALPSRCLEARP